MKLIKDYFYPMVIGTLVIVIILMRSCSPSTPCPEGKVITEIKRDTVFKTITNTVTIHKPSPTRIDTVFIDKTIPIDTIKVIKDYFSKITYDFIIPIDTFGLVTVHELITKNRIEDRKWEIDVKVPTITNTINNTVYPPLRNKVFAGLDGGVNITNPINSTFGPSLTLVNKKDQIYNIGLGLSPGGTQIKFGTAWKIKLK